MIVVEHYGHLIILQSNVIASRNHETGMVSTYTTHDPSQVMYELCCDGEYLLVSVVLTPRNLFKIIKLHVSDLSVSKLFFLREGRFRSFRVIGHTTLVGQVDDVEFHVYDFNKQTVLMKLSLEEMQSVDPGLNHSDVDFNATEMTCMHGRRCLSPSYGVFCDLGMNLFVHNGKRGCAATEEQINDVAKDGQVTMFALRDNLLAYTTDKMVVIVFDVVARCCMLNARTELDIDHVNEGVGSIHVFPRKGVLVCLNEYIELHTFAKPQACRIHRNLSQSVLVLCISGWLRVRDV